MSRTRLLATYKLRAQTTSIAFTNNAIPGTKHHQPINPIFALSQHSQAVRHWSTTLLSTSITLPHSANMADMDTYDNEPRTYDGMQYIYSPYANRRIRSYDDLVESNTPTPDPGFRAREGDFNIYPHSGQSCHATPCARSFTDLLPEYPRGGDRSRSRSPGADRDGDPAE